MGHIMSRIKNGGKVIITGSRKRRHSDDIEISTESNFEMHQPKRKKLLTTSQYIYHALYKEQTNSDITVRALGKLWHLHKVYLSQSPYFQSMFNGSWKESSSSFVSITINDPNITLESLEDVFGSLYSDEIEMNAKVIVSTLATATLFQLEGIIDKCIEVMNETTNVETAVLYYEASCSYGANETKKVAFEWLETNLLCLKSKSFKAINVELMTKLVASPDLYVLQTEFSLYTLLRTWIYLKLFPDTVLCDDKSEETVMAHTYFSSRTDKTSFLYTKEGQPYLPAFNVLRSQYLVNHHMDIKLVYSDNIIPQEWLNSHVVNHWNAILKIDHTPAEGPKEIDKDIFDKNCMRCGRVISEPGYHKWRWTGFIFGVDLIVILDSRVLSIRRHHRNEHERLLSLQTKRQFMIKASVTSINSQRQRVFTQKSEIKSLSLEKNEESVLLILDSKLIHPLFISLNLLVVAPNNTTRELTLNLAEVNQIPISEIGANLELSVNNDNNSEASSSVRSIASATSSSSIIFPTLQGFP